MKEMTMKTLRFSLSAVLVVISLLAFAWPAQATQTGELQGYVVDDSGLPVVGVRVILSSPQMIGGEKTTETDRDGRFRFPNLDVGLYKVTLSHPQFRGFTEDGIEISIDARVIRD